MAVSLAELFPHDDHRFQLTLRKGEVAAFFAPAAPDVLEERADILRAGSPAALGCTAAGGALVEELAALAASWRPTGVDSTHDPGHPPSIRPPLDLLHELGGRLEPDLLLLSETPGESPRLEAGVICFPSSWTPGPKFGHSLDFIHAVVPGLNEQLGRQIGNFLHRLAPGAAFERANWGLTADPERNHHPFLARPRLLADTPLDRIWLRIEDQLFTRLPRTGAILFGIRLRILPLRDVVSDPTLRAGFVRALASLPDPLAAYKGLRAVRPSLLASLTR